MAGITARLARALHKSNISQLIWLALRGAVRTLRLAALWAIAAILPTWLMVVVVVSMAVLAIGGVMLGWSGLRAAGAPVGSRDGHPDQPLDITQVRALLMVTERDRNALGSGARRAADAVNIAFGDIR